MPPLARALLLPLRRIAHVHRWQPSHFTAPFRSGALSRASVCASRDGARAVSWRCVSTSASATSVNIVDLLMTYGDNNVELAKLLCDRHADADATKIAVRCEDQHGHSRVLTFSELRDLSSSFAHFLEHEAGVRKGDVVAVLLPRGAELAVAAVAVWRLGAVYVPLFCAFGQDAVEYRLVHSRAKVVITDAANRGKIGIPAMRSNGAALDDARLSPSEDGGVGTAGRRRRAREHASPASGSSGSGVILDAPLTPPQGIAVVNVSLHGDADPSVGDYAFWPAVERNKARGVRAPAVVEGESPLAIVYTSGTTGKPKGVVVPVRALASFEMYMRDGLEVRPDDRFCNMGDPGWAYGLYYALLGPLALGTTTVFVNARFEPHRCLETMRKYGITNFAAAPTVYRSLRAALVVADGSGPVHKLRRASSAGEPLEPEVARWGEGFFGVRIRDHYGQTELGMVAGQTGKDAPSEQHVDAQGGEGASMGRALPGFTLAVVEPSEEEARAAAAAAPSGEKDDGEAGVHVEGPGATERADGTAGELAVDVGNSPLFWFRGYLSDPVKSASRFGPRGHYLTGDVAYRDAASGAFVFTGRADDVIKTSGHRVGPFEVESALAAHPRVAEAACIGVPDDVKGHVIKAYLVLAPHAHAEPQHSAGDGEHHGRHSHAHSRLIDELRAAVRVGVGAHAIPRHFEICESLPKTPSGKVQRNVLKAMHAEASKVPQR